MFTDRMRKAIKKLVLAKSMQESSNKLPNLQTGDPDGTNHPLRKSTDESLPRKESPDAARSSRSSRSSGHSSKTSKSLSYYLKKAKRVQEKRQKDLEDALEAHIAEISDSMSQKSKDENKSRSSTKTREISTRTERKNVRSPENIIRHVP